MVNEQMWLGHFDIWSNGSVLLYRHGALLGDDGLLSIGQAQALVEIAIDECPRFYPAFQVVLWGDKRSEEHTSELQSLLRSSYAVFCLNQTTRTKSVTKTHTSNKHNPLHPT